MATSHLAVRFDKADISLADLEHLLTTLDYRTLIPPTTQAAQATF